MAAATLPSTLRNRVPYGRAARVRSCARRSLAAETIFMALVICCVFLTERMRRRMSIKLGMCWYRRLPRWFLRLLRRRLRRCRLPRGLLGYKPGLEFLDDGSHFLAQRVIQNLFGPDLIPNAAMGIVDKSVQFLFELAAPLDR